MRDPITTDEYQIRTEGKTVVVDLPNTLTLDDEVSEQINEEFADAIADPRVDSVMTLLYVENALSTGVFDEVKKGAQLANTNDIERWAVVVAQRVKGMAFDSSLEGLETRLFEDEPAAREWLST